MKRQKFGIALGVILAVLLCSSGIQSADRDRQVVKYTLYIGLNDKDTYQQEIGSETAEEIVTNIVLSMQTALPGFWPRAPIKTVTGS